MVYIKIKENSSQAKAIIQILKAMPYVEFIEKEKIPNKTTINAIEEARRGNLKRFKNVTDLINDLKS